ncbi:hypothetical protein DE146DRAFT_783166 [Phaeosphaeria sp. MPI-PUGE-AT-0046c]|nr:hypothetical protein DE146DRAFT_783166 [Phaeosphaeria sp. MPI-PUGE-AT-0046c]
MRAFTSYIFAFIALACYVAADCCDVPCSDGTSGTPCCGNGECNVFCCNCDGGCRQENFDQCVNLAGDAYDHCMLCPKSWSICDADCDKMYDDAVVSRYNIPRQMQYIELIFLKTSCHWQYPSKRSTPLALRNPSDDDIFSMVDHQGNGNITLDQYIQYMQGKNPGMQEILPSQADWAAWFNKFDANGDGLIDVDEHHRHP